MVELRKPISIDEAIQRIMNEVKIGDTEVVPLEKADQRFLAEDLVADHPIPHFDRSGYDGFALRAEDTVTANINQPIRLRVIESIAAGEVASLRVGQGKAIRIMTGAEMPVGANAVVMLEQVHEKENESGTWIEVSSPLKVGDHLVLRGEDTAEGSILAKAGRRINPGEMAMLATFGYAEVKVFKQPVVGIYTTGTELLPVEAALEPGKIRNSNAYMLASQVSKAGGIPKYLGILPDDLELCYQSVKAAFEEVDYLITTGGAAVGDFDFVQTIVERLGAELLFNKIAMRPGSVTTIAKLGEKWLFGLSGNPAACFVGFELFTRPVLRTYLGAVDPHLPRSLAILQTDIKSKNSFTRLMRTKLMLEQDTILAEPVGLDKSNVVSALIEADGLLVVPKEMTPARGTPLEAIWFER